MSLVDELVHQVEAGEAIGLTWQAGDTAAQRRALIDMQDTLARRLTQRGWTVHVGVERPAPGIEVFAVRIDPEARLSPGSETQLEPE